MNERQTGEGAQQADDAAESASGIVRMHVARGNRAIEVQIKRLVAAVADDF